MTLKEATDKARSIAPINTHYVSVTKNDAWFGANRPDHTESYCISIQPAINGSECQLFQGESLESCIAQLEVAITNPEPNIE